MDIAIKAAKEVGADLLSPELYRNALEKGILARKEYRFKNFANARTIAEQARVLAERAEYESIRNGGKRDIMPQDPLAEPSYPSEPISTPSVDPAKAPAAPSINK